MKRLIAPLMFSLCLLMVGPASVLAASCTGNDVKTPVTTSVDYGTNCSNGSNGLIINFLLDIVKYLGGLVGLLVVLMIIIGGVQYITAASNPKGIEAAKSRITNAVIALILYILMFGILNYLIPGTFTL